MTNDDLEQIRQGLRENSAVAMQKQKERGNTRHPLISSSVEHPVAHLSRETTILGEGKRDGWNQDISKAPRGQMVPQEQQRAEIQESGAGKDAPSPSLAAREADESAVSHFEIAPAAHGEAVAPSVQRVSLVGSIAGANEGGIDVDRSAGRAPVEAGTEPTSLAGGLESGFDHSFVDEPASGPDVKRAPLSPVSSQPFVVPSHPGLPVEEKAA